MIKFLADTTVTCDRFPAGSISNFPAVIELQLIAQGVAILCPLAVLIAQSYAGWTRSSVNAAGDANFVTLVSVVLPGGTMGPNSRLEICPDWDYPNSASTKTFNVNFGGNSVGQIPQTTGNVTADWILQVKNANSLSAQKIFNSINYGLGATNTRLVTAVDTTIDQNIDFAVKWGAAIASEAITLSGYSIW